MASIKSKMEEKNRTVKIFMNCGRLTIDSSTQEWINPTTKVKREGIVLKRKRFTDSFVELNLALAEDKKVYDRFLEWIADGTDWRIKWFDVYELKAGDVKPPFSWWNATAPKKLMEDVARSVESMEHVEDRERFVEHCIDYENSRENPRKSLVKQLMEVELDVAPADEMTVPAVVGDDE